MQIESLSKRLDRFLYCKAKIAEVEPVVDNYWKVVKRMPMKDWKKLSPAQVTIQVIDPMLKAIAQTLNNWEEAAFAPLDVIENDVVASFVCTDGTVPVRLLLCPTPDEEEIVIIVDLLAKRLTTDTP